MLRLLSNDQNIRRFQHFCGLQWENIPSQNTPLCQCTSQSSDSLKRSSSTSQSSDEDSSAIIDIECSCCTSTCVANDKVNRKQYKSVDGTLYRCNWFVHQLFKFGSELGNEVFFITFLPFVFWNIDDYVGRRLIVLWVFNMYAGQGLKDLLCWPRPQSSPVLRLENTYENEYGMPSTHAVAGFIIPFALFYFTYDRFKYQVIYGILFFMAWTSLVCLSRIYHGVHTYQDILAGLSIAAFMSTLWLPYLDLTLEIFLSSPNAWIFILLVPLLMIYVFPTRCIESRNDTIRIISTGCGCMLAAWSDYYLDQVPLPQPYKGAPRDILPGGFIPWALFGASRFVIGICLVVTVKIALKFVIRNIGAAFQFFNTKASDKLSRDVVTLPYLFITYTAIGYTAVYVTPKAFQVLGLIF